MWTIRIHSVVKRASKIHGNIHTMCLNDYSDDYFDDY